MWQDIGDGEQIMASPARDFRNIERNRHWQCRWSCSFMRGLVMYFEVISNDGRDRVFDLGLLAVLWLLAVFIIDPRGEFPINDDWVYIQSVRRLIGSGIFDPGPVTTAALFSHVLWGAAVCLGFECSYEVLRVAGLVWGCAGLVVTYLLLRQVRAGRTVALIAAACVGFNPIYPVSAGSFMTDVPFVVMMTLACLFFTRALRTSDWRDVSLGAVAACIATLNRQIGLAVPAAFCAIVMLQAISDRSQRRLSVLLKAVLPVVFCLCAFILLQRWEIASGIQLKGQSIVVQWLQDRVTNPAFLRELANQFTIVIPYLGWFLVPVLLQPAVLQQMIAVPWRMRVVSVICGVLAGVAILWTIRGIGHPMPLYWNIIVPQGIGPLTLHDVHPPRPLIPGSTNLPPLSAWFWLLVTVASVIGGMILVARLVPVVLRSPVCLLRPIAYQDAVSLFFVTSSALYLVPTLTIVWYDRYLLPVVPLLAAAVSVDTVGRRPGWQFSYLATASAGVLLIVMGGFTVLGTADYMAWNRTRWMAIRDLLASGVAQAAQIDGGYEFNGPLFFDLNHRHQPGKSYWWVQQDDYLITFGNIPGAHTFREYRYASWLHTEHNIIRVVQRHGPAQQE